jgi:hypothetical protein
MPSAYKWNKNKKNPIWFVNAYGGFIVVRQSNQIKLADGTNTTFDAGNPDIRYADGGKVKSDYIKKIKETIEYVENSAKARMIIDFEDEEGSQQAINEGKDYERIFPLKKKAKTKPLRFFICARKVVDRLLLQLISLLLPHHQ